MRIAIDARIVHYSSGGIRRYTLHLLEWLAALDANSEYRVLHSRHDPRPPEPGPNFRTVSCWTPSHHRLERWALSGEVARLRCDLLHSPDYIPPALGYRRSVITVHDLTFLHYPEFLTPESRRYYNDQIAWAVQRADRILADSHATKADLVRLLGVPRWKIRVVHLGVDPGYRPLPRPEVRPVLERHGLEPGYVLFVGTLEPRKNVPGLLEAYRMLVDGGSGTPPLVIVGGKGWLYEETFDRVEALGLASHVRFLDRVPEADLPALYNAASLLAMPSFYEGFGLPALEAMACGTPVVASDRASLPEVVGDDGLLVDPESTEDIRDALDRLLSDGKLRRQLGRWGRLRSKRFSWKRMAEQTLSVYRWVAGDWGVW